MVNIDVLGQFAKADTLRNNEERAKHNRLFEAAQMKQIEQQQAAAEEKRLRDSYLEGAANLKALIENGQTDRVMPYLQGREQDILSRNGDPSETRQVMQMAQAGDFQNILNLSNANLQAAAQLGHTPPIPQAKDTRTTLQKDYDRAVQGGFKGSFMDYQTAVKKAGASNTTVNVNPEGRQAPTKSNETLIQKDVLKAQTALKDLQKVADTHSDEFLTSWGRVKAGVGSVLDKMNLDIGGLADFNAQRVQFANAAKQMFNQYRKEITGAAASEKEMKDLLESMFNDDQGPKEFKASFDLFMDKAEENLRMAQQNATQGIDVEGRNAAPSSTPVSDADLFKKYGIE